MEKLRKKEITIQATLYTYYTSKDGTHPVRLKVTANRSTRFYPIQFEGQNIFATKPLWEELQSNTLKGKEKKIRLVMADTEAKAREAQRMVMQNGRPFDFVRFEKEFLQQESKKGIISLWENYLDSLLQEGRTGTYNAYENALQSFRYFRGMIKKDKVIIKKPLEINPSNITVQILKDFDSFLVKRGCGKTTISMYMRSLRVVYNIAATENPSLREFYPFAIKQNDKGKYKIRTGSGSKGETLSPSQLKTLINSEAFPGTPEYEAKMLWLFSFYCQGMNFKDLSLLKNKDVKDEAIKYVRHKTKQTEIKEMIMEIPLNEKINQILYVLGNPDRAPGSYVFNILSKEMSALKAEAVIKQKIKLTNKWMKRLCKKVDLPTVTTYAARHSYANLLKQSGVSVEMIRELLGHSDLRTTELYLKRFDIKSKQEITKRIDDLLSINK